MTETIKRLTDLDALLASPDQPIREILGRINGSPGLFQLVVDGEGRLIGTVTDGDVRRALLAGVTLDQSAATCLRAAPTVGRAGAGAINRALLAGIRSVVPFLPIVDGEGRLVEVLILERFADAAAVALVMAGGRGRRLGERTRTTPKPLIPVGGRPMIEHVLESLEAAGIREVHVSVNYLAEQVERFCETRRGEARFTILREETPLGTAGALALLPRDLAEPVVVMNGDVISRVDVAALLSFHRLQDLDVSLAVVTHEVHVPFGVVRTDAEGLFEGVDEKPVIRNFVAAGIYVIGPEARALVPRRQPIDMPDLLNLARQARMRVGVFPLHEAWRDVGRPSDLEAAEAEARDAL